MSCTCSTKKRTDIMKVLHARNQNLLRELDKAKNMEYDLQGVVHALETKIKELQAVVAYQDKIVGKKKAK